MKIKSVTYKIAGISGLSLIILSTLLVGYGLLSSKSTQQLVDNRVSELIETRSLENLKNLAGNAAGEIQTAFTVALDAARTMAETFALTKSEENSGFIVGRDQINGLLYKILEDNPDFNGTYSCWEPNALDGKDEDFKTGKDGNNATTGRFTPYWNRDERGHIAVQPLVEYDTMDKHPNGVLKGGWYIYPREKHIENVLDPFPYIVQGKSVWLTTLSVPILANDRFYGVAGTDYNLDFLQHLSEEIDANVYDGKAKVAIVSNGGLIVAESANPDLIGKELKSIEPAAAPKILEIIRSGESSAVFNKQAHQFEVIAPINLGRTGKPWAIMIYADEDTVLEDAIVLGREIQAKGESGMTKQAGIGLVACILAIVVMWFASKSIVKPIQETVDVLKDIAEGEGDLTKRLEIRTEDEIGEMGKWFNAFMDNLQGLIKEVTGNTATITDASMNLAAVAPQMSSNADSMSQRSGDVAAAVEQMSANLTTVAAASEEASSNVHIVAAATEEMTSTVREIAQNSEKARMITNSAVEQTNQATEEVSELGKAADEINNVTEVINEISNQIDLLALNATIEAAKAGESGKGFAVVASEVKELAKQTSVATDEIQGKIEGIQRSTKTTVTQIEKISEVIHEVNSIVATIAASVEEQAATSQEIAGNVNQASQGIQEVNRNVTESSTVAVSISEDVAEFNQSVQQINDSAGLVNINVEDLSKMADSLKSLVGRFRI